ncbi:hypothetical protein [Leuconostoc mesenteroides]|uniref:hypothetical protein n=1 Tax=Leuconostoc mesenteroides TaxID=1245 RepID=UPI002360541A|nr:hypothetical protein [Leuconostoc mesenteroides]
MFLGLDVGSWADWVSGIGTFFAIIISVQITKKQIIADKEKDRESFFLQQDYLAMNNIQEKLLSNKIFIENARYTLEATLVPSTDDDIKEFWTKFIRNYRDQYRTLVDNNNYIRNKIYEYEDLEPLIKDIINNELRANNKIASYLYQENAKMDGYLASQESKKYLAGIYDVPDKEKIIPILNKYSQSYGDLMTKIKAVKFKLRKRL